VSPRSLYLFWLPLSFSALSRRCFSFSFSCSRACSFYGLVLFFFPQGHTSRFNGRRGGGGGGDDSRVGADAGAGAGAELRQVGTSGRSTEHGAEQGRYEGVSVLHHNSVGVRRWKRSRSMTKGGWEGWRTGWLTIRRCSESCSRYFSTLYGASNVQASLSRVTQGWKGRCRLFGRVCSSGCSSH
jgi:hypothetical protein